MRTPTSRHVRRAAVALVMTAALSLAGLGAASPAGATSQCATAGHAYLTQPGRVIFSGFEGNQQFGVPTESFTQGSRSYNVGGNGIRPGSAVGFIVVDRNTGAFLGGAQTLGAGSNCVANERATTFFSQLAPGNYQVQASYQAGNSGAWVVNEPVANLDVSPAPPPPPPIETDPCQAYYSYYFCGFTG